MRVLIFTLVLIFVSSVILFAFLRPEYRSAFEADQACHYEKWASYGDRANSDCDHDIETRQWILFSSDESSDRPAEIIKRYRY